MRPFFTSRKPDQRVEECAYSEYGQGRWLAPDPLAGDVSNPQSLNRYVYVLNNPTTNIDPLGLWCYWGCGGGGLAGGGMSDWGLGSGPFGGSTLADLGDQGLGGGWGNTSLQLSLGLAGTLFGDGGIGGSGMGSGPLSGDYGVGLPPPGGGGGLPCDFGTCGPGIPVGNGFGEEAIAGTLGAIIAPEITVPLIVASLAVDAYLAYKLYSRSKNAKAAEKQYQEDLEVCRALQDPGARSRCYESALNRKNRKEQGWDPLPPLITW